MKTNLLLIIAAFLVLLPWIQSLDVERNGEATIDGITYSAMFVMPITLAFSLVSWFLFSWASHNITSTGIILSVISGAALVIPFLEVLGPMAGMLVGIVAGFAAFMIHKKILVPTKNRPLVFAGIIFAATYFVLIVAVLAAQGASNGISEWTGTAEGMEKTGFDNVFGNNIGFEFFLAIVPSLVMTVFVIKKR